MAYLTSHARPRRATILTTGAHVRKAALNEVALVVYVAILNQEAQGVSTFKVEATSARVAFMEISRWAKRARKGWKIAVYDGPSLVATRGSGDTCWVSPRGST